MCQWGRVVQKKPILNRTIDFEAKRIQFCRFESRGRAKRQFHYDWSKVQESLAKSLLNDHEADLKRENERHGCDCNELRSSQ